MNFLSRSKHRARHVVERASSVPAVPRMREPVQASVSVSNPASASVFEGLGFVGFSRSNVSTLPRVSPELAQKHATVTAACSVIAGDLAKLPLQVFERGADGRERRLRDHPAEYLLNTESSAGVPAKVARFGLSYSFCLRGRGFAYAPRDAGGELELIESIRPDQMMVLRDGRARFYEFEDGAGIRRRVAGRVMVHLRYMAEDGWTSRSPIEVAAESLGIALAGQEAAARQASGESFKQIAKISAFDADDETWERQRSRLKDHMRRDRDSGVLIVGSEDDFKTLGASAADLQLLESRKFDREQIIALYRVPPSKLQMLEHGVKANGEQQAIDYKADCLTHWGGFVENGLTLGLLSEGERRRGLFLRHNYDALLAATTKERFEALTKAVGGPFMLWQEAREIEGMKDLPEGQSPYPPSNMTRKDDSEKESDT
ncbi:phage portal protein [Celeribacter ethanolicus]|uniref:phage portal protein n=1 Tax=Celeribacter ethanolicus TaxID=1758178 RepID=UPI00082C705D|nr:phage portal protein [Celeribacter ethanolicus]